MSFFEILQIIMKSLLFAVLILCLTPIFRRNKKKTENKPKSVSDPVMAGLFSPKKKTETVTKAQADSSIYYESFKVFAKVHFLYQNGDKKEHHSVKVSSVGQENGLAVIDGYSAKTGKQERFLVGDISVCIDSKTGRMVDNLVVFLRLRKDEVKSPPVSVASSNNKPTKADMSAMRRTYEPPTPVSTAVNSKQVRSKARSEDIYVDYIFTSAPHIKPKRLKLRTTSTEHKSTPITPIINNGQLEILLKYTTHGQRIERQISVHGLGKYKDCHYIIAHCHEANAIRHFKLQKFRSCVDLGTGEIITKVKDYILAYNPVIIDLTDEFNALSEQRDRENGF